MGFKALLDIDGVVLDVLGRVKEYIPSFIPENVESYNFGGNIGCDKHDIYKLFKDPDFMRGLKPYNGAVDAIRRLEEKVYVSGWTYVAKEIVPVRGCQLGELGIDGYIYTNDDKEFLPDYDFLFEDKLEPCIQYASAGKTVFLINHTYNNSFDNVETYETVDVTADGGRIIRCRDLSEAVDICLRICNEKSV